jgi:site-specific recombinase XerD
MPRSLSTWKLATRASWRFPPLRSYTKTLDHLKAFFSGEAMAALTLDALDRFRASRASVAACTATKEIMTLRSFFAFCCTREWIAKNPATGLERP